MKTDDLIRMLSHDLTDGAGRRPWSPGTRLAIATGLGGLFVTGIVVGCLSPSDGLGHGLPTAIVTVLAALALAGAAYRVASSLARPDAGHGFAGSLWIAPAILTAGLLVELVRSPASEWPRSLMGADPLACFSLVTLLSVPILAVAILALRSGAPTHPTRTGALAGALAGGVCAAIYELHCPENSLLFIAAWHAPAVLVVVGLGAVLGRRYLRW